MRKSWTLKVILSVYTISRSGQNIQREGWKMRAQNRERDRTDMRKEKDGVASQKSEKEKGVEGTMYHHEVRRGAAVGTRLTPSKNDRRCLPCFLQASQFQPLLLVVSSCCYPPLLLLLSSVLLCSAACEWRAISDAVNPDILYRISFCLIKSNQFWKQKKLLRSQNFDTFCKKWNRSCSAWKK